MDGDSGPVGIAPTKTLAKAAYRLAKKDADRVGVCLLLTEQAQREALDRMELTDLCGVWENASRSASWRSASSIRAPCDADPRFVRGHFSVVLERVVYELRGTPCLALEEVTPDRKSIMASRSFCRAIETKDKLHEGVAVYVARAAEEDAPPAPGDGEPDRQGGRGWRSARSTGLAIATRKRG